MPTVHRPGTNDAVPPPLHPPAWYPDPDHPDRIRRWNGRAWTDDVRPRPAWLRTVRLAPGPPAKVPRTSRRLWATSAALLAVGALAMLVLGRGARDPDRIDDRRFAAGADARCADVRAALPERERSSSTPKALDDLRARTAAWEGMVDDVRAIPTAGTDDAAVSRWLGAWDRWLALRHDYAGALERGAEEEARRVLEQAQVPHAALTRFALVNGMNACVFR